MDPKLCEAAMNGDLNYFQGIIGSQEPLNLLSQLTPKSNHTILHIAVEFNQTAFVEAITQHRPSLLWLPNSVGDTALHVAARSEALQHILEILINVATSPTNDVETSQSERGIWMLRRGNFDGDTALHCAARMGNERCVELLMKADPELCSLVNKANESPLYLAADSGNSRALKFILDVALPLTPYKGPNGLTALHAAQLLFKYDVPLPSTPWKGPLLIALHAAQLLFKYGCEVNKMLVNWRKEMISETDDSGSTPLHYAALYGETQAVKLFLDYDSSAIYVPNTAHEDSALHIAASFGHVYTLKELINRCPDSCYLINNKGRTVLHAAVLGNQGHVVKFILKTPRLAMLINKPDEDGNTPLHLATLFKLYDISNTLINCRSVDLRIKNKEGFTAGHGFFKDLKETKHTPLSYAEEVAQLHEKRMDGFRHFSYAQELLKGIEQEAMIGNQTEHVVVDPKSDNLKSSGEVNMIVGILVATVSFAATFTMPGGYINDGADEGLATFVHKPAFKAFIVTNAIAFCFSTNGVILAYASTLNVNLHLRRKYLDYATMSVVYSLYAMLATFCTGNYVVLTQSKSLSIAPILILGFFFTICAFYMFVVITIYREWHMHSEVLDKYIGKVLRKGIKM